PQVSDGKLRVLATLLPNRSPLLPEVPTLTEAGMAKVSITPWAGLFGPAKVPPEIVDRISRELTRALARQDVRAQLGRLAFEGQSSTPEELLRWSRSSCWSGAKPAKTPAFRRNE